MDEDDLIASDIESEYDYSNQKHEYIDPDKIIVPDVVHNTRSVNPFYHKQIRSKLSNHDEIIISFDNHINREGIFTQEETNIIRESLKQAISVIPHNQYSILVPIFFVEAFCFKKNISFGMCFRRHFAEEVYVKNACLLMRNFYVQKFREYLGVQDKPISWDHYVRGLMIILRSLIVNTGREYTYSPKGSDNLFMSNTESEFNNLYKEIKLVSTRVIAVALKHNKINDHQPDLLFDKHLCLTLDTIEKESILPSSIVSSVRNIYLANKNAKSSKPLNEAYNTELNIYESSKHVEQISILSMYRGTL